MQPLNRQCPACGSEDVETKEDTREIRATFGPAVHVLHMVDTCSTCGEAGDFEATNDARIDLAIEESIRASVPCMLELLARHGVTMAYLERALELPMRTAARWKSGEHSAAAIALLRIVATFPWVLEVAENGFNPMIADQKLIGAAGDAFQRLIKASRLDCDVRIMSAHDFASVSLRLSKPAPAGEQAKLASPQISFILPGE